jgi:tripartite ATP-independent transporter DctP family solute receptor
VGSRLTAGLLFFAACARTDRPLEIRFGHVGAPGSLFAISAEEFARRANEQLGPRARVLVFGSSQLGSDEVMMQKLKLGTLELALPSTVMSTAVATFGLFEMPYLVKDRAHMQRIEQAIVWPTLGPQAEAAGYRILAVWENGFRHITNNRRPIARPEDLRGIKLRTPTGQWRIRMFQAFGANPSPMPLSEVFVALQTGVMDGQENPFAQIHSARLHEVQRYLSLTSHVYTPAYVTAGLAAWDRLPEDVRAILQAAAREVQGFVYETAERLDRELLAELGASGIQVNEPDRAAFLTASRAIYAEFAGSVSGGRALIDSAVALGNR